MLGRGPKPKISLSRLVGPEKPDDCEDQCDRQQREAIAEPTAFGAEHGDLVQIFRSRCEFLGLREPTLRV